MGNADNISTIEELAGVLVDVIRRYGATELDMRRLRGLLGDGRLGSLLHAARESPLDTNRAIAASYFHRLLYRVFSEPGTPFVLKRHSGGPSSRVKDLADIAGYALTEDFDAERLAGAVRREAAAGDLRLAASSHCPPNGAMPMRGSTRSWRRRRKRCGTRRPSPKLSRFPRRCSTRSSRALPRGRGAILRGHGWVRKAWILPKRKAGCSERLWRKTAEW